MTFAEGKRMACTSGCETQDHESYAECLKDKRLHVAAVDSTVNGKVVTAGE